MTDIENKRLKHNNYKKVNKVINVNNDANNYVNKKPISKLDFKTQELKRKRPNKKIMLDIKNNIKNNNINQDNDS